MNTSHIWAVADLLRGDYKQSEYGKVILPFTVLRRLDCVLEKTKDAVLAQAKNLPAKIDAKMKEVLLNKAAGANFHNVSKYTWQSLLSKPDEIKENLTHYIQSFNQDVNEVFIVYPAYKESGVEWLGEVPAHCEGCSRQNKIDKVLRFLWRNNRGKTYGT
jgi:type I restriction enzyme M protein